MILALFRSIGMLIVLGVFALGQLFMRQEKSRISWCRRSAHWMLKVLSIQVELEGSLPPDNHLIVANHISWLDPLILLRLGPIQFITHTAVRDHPVFGWITQLGLCHFWDRRGSQLKKELEFAAHALDHHHLGIFPEGTSHNGLELLDFKAAPFEIAIKSIKPVLPIYIHYRSINGHPLNLANHKRVAYYGGMTFGESLWNILRNKKTMVHIQVYPAVSSEDFHHRKELKDHTQDIFQKLYQENQNS